jgi:hypothetical protein
LFFFAGIIYLYYGIFQQITDEETFFVSGSAFFLVFLWLCSASKPKTIVTSSQQFYLSFRKAPDMETRKEYVKAYKDFAEGAFYDHIVRMLSDRSFREIAPVEYRSAVTLGMMLAKLYNEEYQDSRLLETYRRLKLEEKR